MRLIGIEPDIKTDADIRTYACIRCDRIEVTLPPTVH
jgi:hypothetical protein